mmetsp:Transcript_65305/g.136790  ORF Transcript_65305/g.136790 Transcript_65305/m.136790 type:complete len:100 (-) Transcript_65305:82-381(-)
MAKAVGEGARACGTGEMFFKVEGRMVVGGRGGKMNQMKASSAPRARPSGAEGRMTNKHTNKQANKQQPNKQAHNQANTSKQKKEEPPAGGGKEKSLDVV